MNLCLPDFYSFSTLLFPLPLPAQSLGTLSPYSQVMTLFGMLACRFISSATDTQHQSQWWDSNVTLLKDFIWHLETVFGRRSYPEIQSHLQLNNFLHSQVKVALVVLPKDFYCMVFAQIKP